jgi:hypothetical protein
MDFDFTKISYHRHSNTISSRYLTDLIGFDSEAYITGKPFLYTTSLGDTWGYKDIPHCLFSRKYINAQFVVYNMRYESGAILHALPIKVLKELRKKTKVEHNGYKYKYFPHKFLRISRNKNAVTFWDIAPFFKMSLDAAAAKYLNEHKIDIETKSFTEKYVTANSEAIFKYCLNDSRLTKLLADFLLSKLNEFGMQPTNLYSQASVSFSYFKKRCGVIDVWRFWHGFRQPLQYACNAYSGGKFEIQARGKFNGVSYDIDSAYPFEMANLKDIRDAGVVKSDTFLKDADYGFIRAKVKVPNDFDHPISIKLKGIATFPAGEFTCYMTKTEFDYFTLHDIDIQCQEGWFFYCHRKGYPYRDAVLDLWKIKDNKEKYDKAMRDVAKINLNGQYGKFIQLTEEWTGTLRAGPGWNPFYGAIITANVRVRMCELQHHLGVHALAVHTDGIISDIPLENKYLGKGIGKLVKKLEGDGLIIACGIYELAGKCADRGYKLKEGFKWSKLLREMGNRSIIKVPTLKVLSWIGAIHEDRPDDINLFIRDHKDFNVNCDTKRIWSNKATGASLLRKLQYSEQRHIWS